MSQLDGHEVGGRAVKIKPGIPKRSGRTNNTQPRVENHKVPTFDRWSRTDASDHWQNPASEGKRLWVGGLPRIASQLAVDAEMQRIFQGFTLTAVSNIISPHASKAKVPGDHYYLFVDLLTADDVDAAAQKLNGTKSPWGGRLRVSRARVNEDRKVMREQYRREPQKQKRKSLTADWRRME